MTLEEKYHSWKKDTLPGIINDLKADINDSSKFKKKESQCYKVKVRKENKDV